MTPGLVSVIVPSRSEKFTFKTVQDLLAKAAGPIEILVILDGWWCDPPLPDDPRLIQLHRGQALGMRPAINAAVEMSSGQYILKCDAHTMWDEGYDEKLKADYHEDNWVIVPRRYALDPDAWTIDPSNKKYPIDYHYLSEPFAAYGDSTPGLHGTAWTARRDARKDVPLDDELTSQGSSYFMSRAHWDRLGPLDASRYGSFWHEFQEIGLKTWLSGGAVKVAKRTYLAHLYKGKRYGRGYSTRDMGHEDGTAFCAWFWMTDQAFPGKQRSMRWLIEKFAPVPTWPADLDVIFRRAHDELKNPHRAAVVQSHAAKDGDGMALEIKSAKYGIGEKTGEFVDVTAVVNKLVTKKGRTTLTVSNETLAVGKAFPGKRKRLWVEYTDGGKTKTANAIERKTLRFGA